jgi:hypothetical protein
VSLQSKGYASGAFVGVNTKPFARATSVKEQVDMQRDKDAMYGGNGCWRSPVVKGKEQTETGCFVCPCDDCQWDTTALGLKHKKGKEK